MWKYDKFLATQIQATNIESWRKFKDHLLPCHPEGHDILGKDPKCTATFVQTQLYTVLRIAFLNQLSQTSLLGDRSPWVFSALEAMMQGHFVFSIYVYSAASLRNEALSSSGMGLLIACNKGVVSWTLDTVEAWVYFCINSYRIGCKLAMHSTCLGWPCWPQITEVHLFSFYNYQFHCLAWILS